MKTLAEIEAQIKTFQDKFGTDIIRAEQGSTAWLQTRLGVITASEVGDAIAGVKTKTRNTYMCKLVAEVCAGMIEEINSKYMDWGKMNEDAARSSYEFANDCEIQQVSFIFKDDSFREGCSLDGFVNGKNKAVEIKCPYNTTNFIKFLVNEDIKKEYELQHQFQMRCTGVDVIDHVQWDPRMIVSPRKEMTVERDPKIQATFDELIPAFIHDMDKMLELIGIQFGAQWRRLATEEKQKQA